MAGINLDHVECKTYDYFCGINITLQVKWVQFGTYLPSEMWCFVNVGETFSQHFVKSVIKHYKGVVNRGRG